jgi:hypothetical protein
MVATAGNLGASMAATLSTCSTTSALVGWAKMVRMAAATISAEPLGTLASTLRRKWTRQTPTVNLAVAWLAAWEQMEVPRRARGVWVGAVQALAAFWSVGWVVGRWCLAGS